MNCIGGRSSGAVTFDLSTHSLPKKSLKILGNQFCKTVLVSTHGCAMRGLLNSLRIAPREDYWNGGVPKNCSVAIVESTDGSRRLLEENKVYASV